MLNPRARSLLLPGLLAAFAAVGCNDCDPKGAIFDSLYGEWKYHCGPARAKGERCEVNEECVPGTFCDAVVGADGNRSGVCSDAWFDEGATCTPGSPACPRGTFCELGALTGTCHLTSCAANGACDVGAATGGTCDQATAATACGPGRVCVLASPTSGSCEPAGALGETCTGEPTSCAAGLFCAIPDLVCRTAPPNGTRCTINESCGPGRFCLTASLALADWENPGTCQDSPNLGPGSPCVGPVCARGFHCDYGTNTCARDRDVGASCSNGNECGEYPGIARECVRGKCVATDRTGAACWPGPSQRCSAGLQCVVDVPR
jgi:hypothetical protein